MIEIHLILLFMIAAAWIAIEAKDLLSSVVGVGAVGIGLCMAFLVLKAPDLAMMQLVVEILSLVILVRATARKDLPFSASGRWAFNTVSTIIFIAVFLTAAFFVLRDMPKFASPIMKLAGTYINEGPARTGAGNVVAAITLNYRSLDTLGEAIALFTVIVGVLAVSRKIAREKADRP
jgi:multicomponent Na+:H+ antiporter subunit B